jgi:hypothetical protein
MIPDCYNNSIVSLRYDSRAVCSYCERIVKIIDYKVFITVDCFYCICGNKNQEICQLYNKNSFKKKKKHIY